jgi:hypothetical protein
MVELQSSLDLESFWRACLKLIECKLPHRSCSLMFNIVDFKPADARHHVVNPRNPDYVPATSLTVSGPFLARHPLIKLYTYSEIVAEDPDASWRRLAQEHDPEWTEFVHLAFWHDQRPGAVLSIHRPPDQTHVSREERAFLEELYPMVEASLRRLRAVERALFTHRTYERYLQPLPLASMFVDAGGELLFATAAAEKQCGRWNRGLRGGLGGGGAGPGRGSLPEGITDLVPGASGVPQSLPERARRAGAISVKHPSVPGLAVKIEVCREASARSTRPWYELTFMDDAADQADAAGPSQGSLLAL